MAHQFKLTITYLDTSEASIWWNDDDTIESIIMPTVDSADIALKRLETWRLLVDYCRLNKIDHFHCKKQ